MDVVRGEVRIGVVVGGGGLLIVREGASDYFARTDFFNCLHDVRRLGRRRPYCYFAMGLAGEMWGVGFDSFVVRPVERRRRSAF